MRRSVAAMPAVVICALLALYTGAAVSLRVFPTEDGPALLYTAAVARSLMHGDASSYHSYFALGTTLGSHVLFLYFFNAMGTLFDLLTAEKIFVALYLSCTVLAFRYLVRSLDGDVNSFVVLLVLPFAANVSLYLGFYDYCIGVPAALFVIGYWLRCWKRHFTPFRCVAALLSTLAAATIHQTAGLIVLLFIAVHLALCAIAAWRAHHGSLAKRLRSTAREMAWPTACALLGAVLALLLLSGASMEALPAFNRDLRRRAMEFIAMRPLSPYASRYYRAALLAAFAVVVVAAVAALWRNRLFLPGWQVAGAAAGTLAIYLIVPTAYGKRAYLPERFGVYVVLLVASIAAVFPLGRRGVRVVAALAALAIALGVLVFQTRTNRALVEYQSPLLDTAPERPAILGAVVEERPAINLLGFDPQMWAGATYLRRSGAALLNAPWMEYSDSWLHVRKSQECQYLNPVPMTDCLLRIAGSHRRPPIDLLVAIHATPETRGARKAERIAERYGLTRRIASSPSVSIYTRAAAIGAP